MNENEKFKSHLFSLVALTFSSLSPHTQPENVRVLAKQSESRLEHNRNLFALCGIGLRGHLWMATLSLNRAFSQIAVGIPEMRLQFI